MSLWIKWKNNIQLTWKLAWILRTYKTCNSSVGFSKYKFYNKLLDGVTLLKVTLGVTWTQHIYIYIWWVQVIFDITSYVTSLNIF